MMTFPLTTEVVAALSYGTSNSFNISNNSSWAMTLLRSRALSFTKISTPRWALGPAGPSLTISRLRDPVSFLEQAVAVAQEEGLAVRTAGTKLRKTALTCGAELAARAAASIAKPMSRALGSPLHVVANDYNNFLRCNNTNNNNKPSNLLLLLEETFPKGTEREIIIILLSPALASLLTPPPQVYTQILIIQLLHVMSCHPTCVCTSTSQFAWLTIERKRKGKETCMRKKRIMERRVEGNSLKRYGERLRKFWKHTHNQGRYRLRVSSKKLLSPFSLPKHCCFSRALTQLWRS